MKNKLKIVLGMAKDYESLKPIGNDGDVTLYDTAIIGISTKGKLVYSIEKMVELYSKEYGTTLDEAVDWLEYNCFSTYVGEMTPIYVKTKF